MKHLSSLCIFFFVWICLSPVALRADEIKKTDSISVPCNPKEIFFETQHKLQIHNTELSYKAIAGNLLLKDDKGNPKASLFFISYIKDNPDNSSSRPISFCFNGGPGSSSIWLHMGLLGPKRVVLTERGDALPPYHLEDNLFSLLDKTDLVFIDPVSTGFSHAIPPDDSKKYHGVEEDIKSVSDFIRLYITRYNRWESPKFIIGESYGTTRAASLANYLHDQQFIYVNGLVLISSVLNYQSVDFAVGNDLSYLLFLPSYTAAAWYHQKLAPELQADLSNTLAQARAFTSNEYVTALFKGGLLSPKEKKATIERLAYFTGLSPEYIEMSNLRVKGLQFCKELLRGQKRTIGRFDSRFIGIDSNPLSDRIEYDPSMDAIFGAFASTFNQYLKTELQCTKEEPYNILTNVQPWNYGSSNQYLDVSELLSGVMTKNPFLRVFVANGIYDLATPFFATEYTFHHLGLDASLIDHVEMHTYNSGHMIYTHRPSLEKLKADLAAYYEYVLKQHEKNLPFKAEVLIR